MTFLAVRVGRGQDGDGCQDRSLTAELGGIARPGDGSQETQATCEPTLGTHRGGQRRGVARGGALTHSGRPCTQSTEGWEGVGTACGRAHTPGAHHVPVLGHICDVHVPQVHPQVIVLVQQHGLLPGLAEPRGLIPGGAGDMSVGRTG